MTEKCGIIALHKINCCYAAKWILCAESGCYIHPSRIAGLREPAAAENPATSFEKEPSMLKAAKRVSVVSLGLVLAAGAALAGDAAHADLQKTMAPGRGLSLDIGGKHAVGYFESKDNACQLTVVLADVTGGESGLDSPGTRVVVAVLPGKGFQVDASAGKSAEFSCAPDATRMNARVFDRAPYKS
jgi:hypothetical protein